MQMQTIQHVWQTYASAHEMKGYLYAEMHKKSTYEEWEACIFSAKLLCIISVSVFLLSRKQTKLVFNL